MWATREHAKFDLPDSRNILEAVVCLIKPLNSERGDSCEESNKTCSLLLCSCYVYEISPLENRLFKPHL